MKRNTDEIDIGHVLRCAIATMGTACIIWTMGLLTAWLTFAIMNALGIPLA